MKVIRTLHTDGLLEIECPKGLWGVSGRDHESVIANALHYYRQYEEDGEYSE